MPEQPKKPEFRYAKVLKEMHRGAVQDEVDTKLSELISAVREQGRRGTITLTMEVIPQGGKKQDITLKVASKVPQPKLRPALFYATDDNSLQREDPDQQEMFGEREEPGNVHKMPPPQPAATPAPQQAAV